MTTVCVCVLSLIVRHSTGRLMTVVRRVFRSDDDVVTVFGRRLLDVILVPGVLDERRVMMGFVDVVMMVWIIGLEESV